MALTNEQRDRVREAAEAEGMDVSEALRLAEEIAGNEQPPANSGKDANEPPKLYQYHLPFMTAGEVRAFIRSLGVELGGSVPDEGLPSGQWLAKYGGQPGATTPAAEQAAPDMAPQE